mmetsp:Transcript_4941/g.13360  ORF Transcript_4941/g.13360 Transcript_4941/m.13360 type:complete len:202 (-) Transcript_4941:25-630(-)
MVSVIVLPPPLSLLGPAHTHTHTHNHREKKAEAFQLQQPAMHLVGIETEPTPADRFPVMQVHVEVLLHLLSEPALVDIEAVFPLFPALRPTDALLHCPAPCGRSLEAQDALGWPLSVLIIFIANPSLFLVVLRRQVELISACVIVPVVTGEARQERIHLSAHLSISVCRRCDRWIDGRLVSYQPRSCIIGAFVSSIQGHFP